jgi:hypothetical protein
MKIELTPIKWELLSDRFFGVFISIEKREQRDRSFKYSIVSDSNFFLHQDILEFTLNQKEDDSYIEKTRFDSIDKAVDVYKLFVEKCLKEKSKSSYSMAVQYKHLNEVLENPKITESRNNFKP